MAFYLLVQPDIASLSKGEEKAPGGMKGNSEIKLLTKDHCFTKKNPMFPKPRAVPPGGIAKGGKAKAGGKKGR